MPIIGETVNEVQIIGAYNGQRSFLKLLYAPNDPDEYPTPTEMANDIVSVILPAMADFSSVSLRYERVSVIQRGPNSGADITQFVSVPGLIVGESLAPEAAFSFLKNPDNATIEGANTIPFTKGGFRLMGIGEASQNLGVVEAPELADMATLAALIVARTVTTVLFGPILLKLYMERAPLTPGGPPDSAAFVASVSARGVSGTQNSRKY